MEPSRVHSYLSRLSTFYSKHYGMGWLHRPIMAYLRKFHNQCACTMVPTESLRRELAEQGFRDLAVVARRARDGR